MTDGAKVVIADYDFGEVDVERKVLEAAGCRLVAIQAKSEGELIVEARDCDAVINQYAHVGAKTIAAMSRCRVVARYGIGVDNVDVDAATKRGILVTNVRDYCTEEVADHAIAMMLTLARKLPRYDRATHAGEWRWQSGRPIYRLRDRTLGIVSLGRIARAIAVRARSFGLRVTAYDPYVDDAVFERYGVTRVDKKQLVEQSDYVIVQCPLTDETRHFFGEAELRRMKPDAILINTGRGPEVDNAALYRALKQGWIAAAGLDDLEEEPAKRVHWSAEDNPLFALDNVIVTSHCAYYSEESIQMAREVAASEVARVLAGQKPHNPVNNVRLSDGSWSLPGDKTGSALIQERIV
jgi:D-3-phosphoglycerate dehydrogenase / 2-oxoglutarate reductase